MINILKINSQNPEPERISQAADIIRAGGVIGYPTETVYGIGANIFNRDAVARIFDIKGRAQQKAIIVIVPTIDVLNELAANISFGAKKLIEAFWPGPLTMIFQASKKVPREITGGGATVAIRIPANEICIQLMQKSGVPITSTSANLAGAPNPVSAPEVAQNLGDRVDLIIDGGPSKSGTPSTVIDATGEQIRIIRAGAIDKVDIERIDKIGKK